MRGGLAAVLLAAAVLRAPCIWAQDEPLASPILANQGLASTRRYWPTVSWRTTAPEAQGMDSGLLSFLRTRVSRQNVLSILVVKNGYIVMEYYDRESNEETLFSINSCTKSITSALMGIAVASGLVRGLDERVSIHYHRLRDDRITLRHLLSMTSGIEWPEWGAWNYFVTPMQQSQNWVEFVLDQPMAGEPGSAFNYNTGGSQLISAILGARAGMPLDRYARQELFGKLGIGRVEWPADPQGNAYGGFGVRMTARDAARFGFLMLNDGVWEGRRILPEGWVAESTREQSTGNEWFGRYGLHWWVAPVSDPRVESMFFAMGYAGQYIFVIPSLDMVVVFFSYMTGEESLAPMKYLKEYIIQAVDK